VLVFCVLCFVLFIQVIVEKDETSDIPDIDKRSDLHLCDYKDLLWVCSALTIMIGRDI
jgi:hypothetical protein